MQWVLDTVAGGIAYDLIKYVLGPLIVAILSTSVLRYSFQKLKERREQIIFFAGAFAVCVVMFFFIGSRPQQPNLVGSIQQVLSGSPGGRDSVTIVSVGIVNTGSMQSIVKKWHFQAKAQGIVYEGIIVPMQKDFTFNNIPRISEEQPESATFKAEDDIVPKGLFPIQTGAFLQGIVYVLFRNVDSSVFKGPVEYELSYEDVLSHKYEMTAKYEGKMGLIAVVPGLHTEMVCRQGWTPPTDITGSLPESKPLGADELPHLNYSPVPKRN